MGWLQTIKDLWTVKTSVKEVEMNAVKAGVKTSEFWVAIITGIVVSCNQYLGLALPVEAIASLTALAVSFILSRTSVKKTAK